MRGVDPEWPSFSADVAAARRRSSEELNDRQKQERIVPTSELVALIDALAEQVDELEEEQRRDRSSDGRIGSLEERLDVMQAELLAASSARDAARKDSAKLLKYVEHCLSEIRKVDDGIDDRVRATIQDLEADVREFRDEQSELRGSLIDLRSDQLAAVENANQNTVETLQLLADTHDLMTAMRTSSEGTADEVARLAERLDEIASTSNDRLRSLEDSKLANAERMHDLELLISGLEDRVQSEGANASSQFAELDGAVEDLTVRAGGAEERIQLAIDRVDALDVQQTEALDASRAEIEANRAALDASRIEIETSRAAIDASREELDASRVDIEATRADIDALLERVENEGDQRAVLDAIADVKTVFGDLRLEVEADRARLDERDARMDEIDARLAADDSEIKGHQEESTEALLELRAVLGELQVAAAESKAVAEEANQRSVEVESIRDEDASIWNDVIVDLRNTAEEARQLSTKAADKADVAANTADALQAELDDEREARQAETADRADDRERLTHLEGMIEREARRSMSFATSARERLDDAAERIRKLEDETAVPEEVEAEPLPAPRLWQFERRSRPAPPTVDGDPARRRGFDS